MVIRSDTFGRAISVGRTQCAVGRAVGGAKRTVGDLGAEHLASSVKLNVNVLALANAPHRRVAVCSRSC